MSRLIQNLESEALIRRVPDPQDGRVQWIHATPEARRLLFEGRARRVAHLERDLRRLSVGDYRALARGAAVLERVARTTDGRVGPTEGRKNKGRG
jgi:DNA-binding MarR family transcriptional regulator